MGVHVGVKVVYGTDEEGHHTVTLLQDQSIEKMHAAFKGLYDEREQESSHDRDQSADVYLVQVHGQARGRYPRPTCGSGDEEVAVSTDTGACMSCGYA